MIDRPKSAIQCLACGSDGRDVPPGETCCDGTPNARAEAVVREARVRQALMVGAVLGASLPPLPS